MEDFDVEAYMESSNAHDGDDRNVRNRRKRSSSRSMSKSKRQTRSSSRGRRRRKPSRTRSRSAGRRRRRRERRRRSTSRPRGRGRRARRDRSASRRRSVEKDDRSRSNSVDSDAGLDPEALRKKRELQDLTRDARTVLVTQLQVKVTERDLKRFFKSFCKVRDVVILKDKFSNRSKGVGYVEVKSLEDVPKAIALNGQRFVFGDGHMGFPIIVKGSEAEKNFHHKLEKQMKANQMDDKNRLYISNLHPANTEEVLRGIFQKYGQITRLVMQPNPSGASIGYAFVHYTTSAEAGSALEALNGVDVGGLPLKISFANSTKPTTTTRAAHDSGVQPSDEAWLLEDDSNETGRTGGGGVLLNAQTRSMLMQNLAGGAGNELLEVTRNNNLQQMEDNKRQMELQQQQAIDEKGVIQGVLSKYLKLKNVFDPQEETEPDWDEDIKVDIISECSKFGKVLHCAVDKESKGNVYIEFGDFKGAQSAAEVLHGRWFGKRMIQAEYMTGSKYREKFPE